MKKLLLFSFLNLLGYFFLYMPHFLRLGFAKLIALLLFLLDKKRKFDLLTNLDFAYNNTLSKEQKKEICMKSPKGVYINKTQKNKKMIYHATVCAS